MPWNPERYRQFQQERSAPFDDLLRLVKRHEGLRVIDLGCGTGELTRRLADALPGGDVVGLDSSPEMLAKATTQARPGVRFELGTIEAVAGTPDAGEWDLIFSNAALHWVDNHQALISRLFALLRPGGQLVVQIPSNYDHPTHRLIVELTSNEPFIQALGGWNRIIPVLSIDRYAELLYAQGGEEITVFEKIYPHLLQDADALVDWTSGTALVPYFERLSEEMRERFLERYRQKLRERFPGSPVFYAFRRTLFAATRPA
ncbi:MAG TPA: methyltransferase domain-containing protein [Ktedonobacterales bacterium]|nr:methyltransferase domain-containing protein [Ktedonobacterales bacterium]